MTTLALGPLAVSSSPLPPTSTHPGLVLLLASIASMNAPNPKWVQVFIAPSVELPLVMSILDIQPFSKPVDMINTLVVSAVVLSSSSSVPLASSVGSSSPLTKQGVECGPSNNKG